MPETRRKFDAEFKAGAVRLVVETRRPIAQVARELGIHGNTLGNWVAAARRDGGAPAGEDLRSEVVRLRRENAELRREHAEVSMERDLLKRSVVLWVKEATK